VGDAGVVRDSQVPVGSAAAVYVTAVAQELMGAALVLDPRDERPPVTLARGSRAAA
jgi:hypothetical protein